MWGIAPPHGGCPGRGMLLLAVPRRPYAQTAAISLSGEGRGPHQVAPLPQGIACTRALPTNEPNCRKREVPTCRRTRGPSDVVPSGRCWGVGAHQPTAVAPTGSEPQPSVAEGSGTCAHPPASSVGAAAAVWVSVTPPPA
eukprot:scaffold4744_cov426-Prasinococcus_capsulatus_cf.AAC.11